MVHVICRGHCIYVAAEEEVERKLEERRRAMEDRGLKISRKKTVYLEVQWRWELG